MRPIRSIAVSAVLGAIVAFTGAARAQVVLAKVYGNSADDIFGWAVGAAGDVNGDGFDDWIAGAPQDGPAGPKSGSVRVVSGKDGVTLHAWNGNSAGDEFGIAVAGAGDVNLDGFADLSVGAHLDDFGGADTGTATVFSGTNGAVLYVVHGVLDDDNIGSAVAPADDLNSDGFDDFIVASHHYNQNGHAAGGVFVYSGQNGTILLSKLGTAVHQDFGHSVALAGDVNHDGTDDLIVGAHGYAVGGAGAGGAFVVSGSNAAILQTFSGDSAGDDMGRAASAAGDVDQDGYPDLFVGMPGDDNQGSESGSARVFSGKTGAILHQFDGDSTSDALGGSVAGRFDVDGDGAADLVVGAAGEDDAGLNTGSVKIYAGATGAELYQLNGTSSGLRTWRALAITDLNADGAPDIVVGIPYDDDAGIDSGVVLIYSGDQLGWSDLASGLGGALGTPELEGKGYLTAGSTTSIALSGAPPGSLVAVVVGFSNASIPLFGGTLVPSPDLVIAGLPANGAGELLLAAPWPAGVPSGTEVYLQEWIVDPSGPVGYTATNALRAVVP